jgi:hypothetical protein
MAEWVWRGYWGAGFADTAKQQAEALPSTIVGAVYPPSGRPAATILGGSIKFFMIALRSDASPPALTGVTRDDFLILSYLAILYGD